MSDDSSAKYQRQDARPGPVLFLLSSLIVGGSERKTIRVANALTAKGFNVHVAYLNREQTLLDSLDSRIPVTCLERSGKISLRAIRSLRSYVQRHGIARIVCINLYPLLYAQAARSLLPSRNRPSVYLMTNTTEHATRRDEQMMALYRPLMRRTSRIIFGNRLQQDLWITRYGLDPRKCEVIYNGVDEVRFSPEAARPAAYELRRRLGLADEHFVIGAVGQLRTEKNQAELLAAMSLIRQSIPAARLLIVGTGPSGPALEAAAAAAGIGDRVHLLGQMDDVRPVLQLMDVFVLPSISETFSNAALEAMAMETAVILSDVGGAREMVTHDVSGLLYRQGDIPGLVALLTRLAHEPDTRLRLGRGGRQAVLDRFSEVRMLEAYEERVIR